VIIRAFQAFKNPLNSLPNHPRHKMPVKITFFSKNPKIENPFKSKAQNKYKINTLFSCQLPSYCFLIKIK
jgi:hypothetical protein